MSILNNIEIILDRLKEMYRQGRYDMKMDLLNKINEEIDNYGWADERLGLMIAKTIIEESE